MRTRTPTKGCGLCHIRYKKDPKTGDQTPDPPPQKRSVLCIKTSQTPLRKLASLTLVLASLLAVTAIDSASQPSSSQPAENLHHVDWQTQTQTHTATGSVANVNCPSGYTAYDAYQFDTYCSMPVTTSVCSASPGVNLWGYWLPATTNFQASNGSCLQYIKGLNFGYGKHCPSGYSSSGARPADCYRYTSMTTITTYWYTAPTSCSMAGYTNCAFPNAPTTFTPTATWTTTTQVVVDPGYDGFEGTHQGSVEAAINGQPAELKTGLAGIEVINGCHPYANVQFGYCPYGTWDSAGWRADGTYGGPWANSLWISTRGVNSGHLADIATHEAAHAYSYNVLRLCGTSTGSTWRTDAQNLFGDEEMLADAITQYYNGANAFTHYMDRSLTSSETTFLSDMFAAC